MSMPTIVFALVALAAFVGVVLSLMYAVKAYSLSERLRMSWETSRPAKLAAEVADLSAVVDANKRATRAELGKIWQKFANLEPARPPPVTEIAPSFDPHAQTCDNWLAAQLEGPRSKAAACMCAYCLSARAARAAEKAAILAERNRAKANGSE
jgi:hypothetical protein